MKNLSISNLIYCLTICLLLVNSSFLFSQGIELTSGVTVSGTLSGSGDTEMYYIDVGANCESMRSILTCGSNDYDLYGRLGAEPTTGTYDWRGYETGPEDVTYDNPGAGRWYIMVNSYSGSGAFDLTVTLTDGGGGGGGDGSLWEEGTGGIYYDEGNVGIGTTPRTDPNKLNMGGNIHLNGNSVNYVHQLHFNDNVRFYEYGNDQYLVYKYGDNSGGGIRFYDGADILQGIIYSDGHNTNPSFGLLDGDGNWAVQIRKDDYIGFRVNQSEKMRIKSNGNVGIGTDAPNKNLEIYGGGSSTALNPVIRMRDYGQQGSQYCYDIINESGVLSFMYAPGSNPSSLTTTFRIGNPNAGPGPKVYTDKYYDIDNDDYYLDLNNTNISLLVAGKVGIGFSSGMSIPGDYHLAVDGKIIATEVTVKGDIFSADYVFKDNYKLRSLFDVDQYIKEYKHLPDVPSEAEVKENGVSLGEMNRILLQKIEEQTLYIIELNKRIEELEKMLGKE